MRPSTWGIALTAVLVPAISAWNECQFPKVDFFAIDEGVGISYTYALAAMNGKMYSGGYTKGNFAFVGVKATGDDINPVPTATLWGTTTSNIQNLYIAEVSADGQMTQGWHFPGSVIQEGELGHGPQTNSIDAASGMHKMQDNAHIAVKGGFKGKLGFPDGSEFSIAGRANTWDQVPFVMKLDVSKTQGIGTGTTGWAKTMDDNYPGGASINSVDGDASGDMILSMKGCSGSNATTEESSGCKYYLKKLAAANGAELWSKEVPKQLSSCRVLATDGATFCMFSVAADATYDFGDSITLTGTDSKIGVVKFNSAGTALWAAETASGSGSDLSVNDDGTLLAVIGSTGGYGGQAFVSRIDTSSSNEGNVLFTDMGSFGTHGFRGVEVTADPSAALQEISVFGQVTGAVTITDTTGASTTLRSRGSYEVFVAAYDATTGAGKYAMDGGGDDMEYFFAFARDPVTDDLYVGGTSRSPNIEWGNVRRNNPMATGDTSSPVGSSKAFTVKLKTHLMDQTLPSCLSSCASNTWTVKAGSCYIDHYCYSDGDAAPYAGAECMKCTESVSQTAWDGPHDVGTTACHIGGKCYASGDVRMVSSGWRSSPSPCEVCVPTAAGDAWSLPTTHAMIDGTCTAKTWAHYAAEAGWIEPSCGASSGRRLEESAHSPARRVVAWEAQDDDE
jgi:hypothetical protein